MSCSSFGDIILMDPTTNDGSFESRYTGSSLTDSTTTGFGAWQNITRTGVTNSGILSRPGANSGTRFDTISASHLSDPAMGGVAAFAQEDATITFTSINLLGTNGYAIQVGDTIEYSFDVNAQGALAGVSTTTSSASLGLDFGNGLVGSSVFLPDALDGSNNGGTPYTPGFHETFTLTHTVTAADVAGGSLQIVAGLNTSGGGGTPTYMDNIFIHAISVPEPSSLAIMSLIGLGLTIRRRR
jgi:hypothetical protein